MTDRARAVTDFDAVVIGGGIAGLVAAWELSRSGCRTVLLEATGQLGGAVARHTVAGLNLDAGAESFATAGGTMADLLADLGIGELIVAPNPAGAWVAHRSGIAPLPAGGLLGIPARPMAADVRRVLGTGSAWRAAADRLLPPRIGADLPTLGGLVRRRMGRAVLHRLVEPVAGGVYSTDPDELETASINPRLIPALLETGSLSAAVRRLRGGSARPGSAAMGVRGGMYTVVETLEAKIRAAGGQIRLHTAGLAVDSTTGRRTVRTAEGSVSAPAVVIAVDGPASAALLGRGPMTAAATSRVLLITLVVDEPALDAAPRGTGVLVSRQARGVQAKALTHATAKWAWLADQAGPGRHVLRLSYGRGSGPLPAPAGAVAMARQDASTLLQVAIADDALVGSAMVRWSSTLPRPAVGHSAAVAELRAGLPPGIMVIGAEVAGTGLAAVVGDARRSVAEVS